MEKKKRSKRSSKNKSNLSDKNARIPCDCEATKHPLVNNCFNCGRIVCLSEGPGPCFFCGNIVSYNNEPLSSSNFSIETENKTKGFNDNKNLAAASADTTLRDKLLEYDKDCASRTTVIDDECDYYQATNNWMTKRQREQWEKLSSEIYNQKHKSRLDQKLSFDLTGRVFSEVDDPVDVYNKMNAIQNDKNFNYTSIDNSFQLLEGAVYVGDDNLPTNITYIKDTTYNNRIQDRSFLEISDQGLCLSMHQPYASLLVRGIKKVEGRTWYSPHRGRLWIASASREAQAEEIMSIEETYRLLNNENIEFPKTYPTGCLLGCVTVTDVISQEEYMKLNSNEISDSPFVFICQNFIELPIKYPIQGKHKIYKLESAIHQAGLTCLEKMCRHLSKSAV